jgi:hypothetical protein
MYCLDQINCVCRLAFVVDIHVYCGDVRLRFGLGYMAICHINMEELAASLSSSYESVQVFLP